MRSHPQVLSLLLAVGSLVSCRKGPDEETLRRLGEANDKVIACKKDVSDLKNELAGLKRQLAQAMANPNRVQLTDPEVINLIASIRGEEGLTGDLRPTLDTKAASRIVLQGARAMQVCYERALKKNQALHYQTGIELTIDITVRSAGGVDEVGVSPSVDKEMSACMKTAAMRWKFPPFKGEPVVVSQKVTLTPKT